MLFKRVTEDDKKKLAFVSVGMSNSRTGKQVLYVIGLPELAIILAGILAWKTVRHFFG